MKLMWNFVLGCVGLLVALYLGSLILPAESEPSKSQEERSDVVVRGTTLPDMTVEQKSQLLEYANDIVQGKEITLEDETLFQMQNGVIVVLWENGRFRGGVWSQQANIIQSVYHATTEILNDPYKPIEAAEDVAVHIFVYGEERPMDKDFVLGLHGVHLQTSRDDIVIWPTYQIERNYKEDKFWTMLCEQAGQAEGCHLNRSNTVTYAPVLHFGQSRADRSLVEYYRGKVMEPYKDFDLSLVRNIQEPAEQWLIDNLEQVGKFVYVYNPSNGVYSTNNNMIRQLMGSKQLADMATENSDLIDAHRRNLEFVLANRYAEEDDNGYVLYDDKSKLGAIAMLLRTITSSPIRDEYTDVASKLANTIGLLQNIDGSLEPRYVEPDYAYDKDYLLTFYSGEGLLAMVEYYLWVRERWILDMVIKSQNYYLQQYVEEIEENYYPAYVPWHTMSLYKVYDITRLQKYADAIFTLNDKLIEEMLHTDDGEPYDLLGRFYNPKFAHYGTPHSASDGVYMEGLVYAYDLAKRLGDTQREKAYWDAISLAVHNLRVLQYRGEDAYFMRHDERVLGAVRFNVNDNRIRIDTTQHMLDGLRKLEEVLAE